MLQLLPWLIVFEEEQRVLLKHFYSNLGMVGTGVKHPFIYKKVAEALHCLPDKVKVGIYIRLLISNLGWGKTLMPSQESGGRTSLLA